MMENVFIPKYRKGKKPTKVRKPSRPLDGINHRLIREQAESKSKDQAAEVVKSEAQDNAPPTRAELETKAKELGIHFDGRTSDKRLLDKITEALKE